MFLEWLVQLPFSFESSFLFLLSFSPPLPSLSSILSLFFGLGEGLQPPQPPPCLRPCLQWFFLLNSDKLNQLLNLLTTFPLITRAYSLRFAVTKNQNQIYDPHSKAWMKIFLVSKTSFENWSREIPLKKSCMISSMTWWCVPERFGRCSASCHGMPCQNWYSQDTIS